MRQGSLWVWLGVCAGCGSTVDVLESTSVTLGPGGGVARSADGIFRVTIAPGALSTEETIVIHTDRARSADNMLSLAYHLAPQHALEVPAQLGFALSPIDRLYPGSIARLTSATPQPVSAVVDADALLADVHRLDDAVYCRMDLPPWFTADACEELTFSGSGEPVAITSLGPSQRGEAGSLAVLRQVGSAAMLEVFNPGAKQPPQTLIYPGAVARAVLGYTYQPDLPALAVVASKVMAGQEVAQVHVYRWQGQHLVPHDGSAAPGVPLTGDCSSWICDGAQTEDSCRLRFEEGTKVTVRARDVDGDGKQDLAIATSSGLPLVYYNSSAAPASALYADRGCQCGRYAQAPTAFEILQLGGAGEVAGAEHPDLVMAGPGGTFVRYGEGAGMGDQLSCGASARLGGLLPSLALARGRFQCSVQSCALRDDLVVVGSKQLGGADNDPGSVRVVYGASEDLSADPDLYSRPGKSQELIPAGISGLDPPHAPRAAQVGDVDGDLDDDVVVLYGAPPQVHVWAGAEDGLIEPGLGIDLGTCGRQKTACVPIESFALADLDLDGAQEIAVLCNVTTQPSLRRYLIHSIRQ